MKLPREESKTMIKEIYINSLDKIKDIIFDQEYDNKINRYRSHYLYRGMPNVMFHLRTTLQRNCKEKETFLEQSILRNFSKYAVNMDPLLSESAWRQLIIGQHYGLPTRLLDWTYSSLVGLHFATSGEAFEEMEKHNAVLWQIDILEMNKLLPEQYRKKLEEENAYLFTIDMLEKVVSDFSSYDEDMSDRSMILLEPPSIDQRIINQYSYFSVVPEAIKDVEGFLNANTFNTVKYIISKEIKWRVRDMLDQLNINERTIFPGLDGLSAWIKRHYYVK